MTAEQVESLQESFKEIQRILERVPTYNGDIKLQCKNGVIQLIDWRMIKNVNIKVNVKTIK